VAAMADGDRGALAALYERRARFAQLFDVTVERTRPLRRWSGLCHRRPRVHPHRAGLYVPVAYAPRRGGLDPGDEDVIFAARAVDGIDVRQQT